MKKAIITEVKKGKHKGEFKFQLIAENGEPVAQSYPESYKEYQGCVDTLISCFPEFIIELPAETPPPPPEETKTESI